MSSKAAPALFRQGPQYDAGTLSPLEPRRHITLFGLQQTLSEGLAFDRFGAPDMHIEQFDGLGNPRDEWDYIPSLLEADNRQPFYTLESGLWAPIREFSGPSGLYIHQDYAAGEGYTIRFGDGVTGKSPEDGTFFKVTFRVNPGRTANVSSNAIRYLSPPDNSQPITDLSIHHPYITKCTNSLPASGGEAEESLESIKAVAPEHFRQNPQRAVRAEDFADILGRIDDFEQVGSVQRWTGSWHTRFLTADPFGAQSLRSDQEQLLFEAGNAIRMVGKHISVGQPSYRAIDLNIILCLEPDAYFGQVKREVLTALFGRPDIGENGFFHPDNFTFGDPLSRASLEAVIQSVSGVRGIDLIEMRSDFVSGFEPFTESELTLGPSEILVLGNDPTRPDQGRVKIYDHSQMPLLAETAGS